MKYYVVLQWHKPGLYQSRDDCKQQVLGFPGAVYKSFPTLESAQFARKEKIFWQKWQLSSDNLQELMGDSFAHAICTDAACPSNPGPVEYRAVDIASGKELFRVWPLEGGSINLAEFLALVDAMQYLLWSSPKKLEKNIIYSDSKIALQRVQKWIISTTIDRTRQNRQLFDKVDRALQWLVDNTHRPQHLQLRQRPTKERWQIPADFGRK